MSQLSQYVKLFVHAGNVFQPRGFPFLCVWTQRSGQVESGFQGLVTHLLSCYPLNSPFCCPCLDQKLIWASSDEEKPTRHQYSMQGLGERSAFLTLDHLAEELAL